MVFLVGGALPLSLIDPNSSREDSITSILSQLHTLETLSVHLFTGIRTRLEDQQRAVAQLSRRLDLAQQKVVKVKECKKAVRILCPARYPTVEAPPSLLPLTIHLPPAPPREEDDLDLEFLLRKRAFPPQRFDPPVQNLEDLKACYHVREAEGPSLKADLAKVGLGPPPREGLPFVDSLLLFNSAENPYQNYRLPLKGKFGPERSLSRRKDPLLPPLPPGGEEEKGEESEEEEEQDDFYYSPPTLGVPDIQVPDFLPDLPGVVESLDFSLGPEEGSFFPLSSSGPKLKVKAKDAKTQRQAPVEQELKQPKKSTVEEGKKQASLETKKLPPPQAPEPEPKTPAPQPTTSFTPAIAAPPPPPPPPGPPIPAAVAAVPPTPSQDDTRSSLMAAIRAAGGAGKASLRSVQERRRRKQEEKEKAEGVAESSDLMADLKNSLAMRRKGISGIRGESGGGGRVSVGGGGGLMATLAARIPAMTEPPLGHTSSSSEAEAEDDWD